MGTGIAQMLPFLATPLLTRLFTEADFAIYTSFLAVGTIFAVAAGGKYHLAIILPEQRKDAIKVFSLSIYITLGYAIILALLFLAGYQYIDFKLGKLIFLVPLYVLFFGIWNAYSYLSIRDRTFRLNAISKVVHAAAYIITALTLGLLKVSLIGLILAKIAGIFSSSLFLQLRARLKPNPVPIKPLKAWAKRYIDYPKLGVAPALLNTISSQALILVLTYYYSTNDLGLFGLTYMVLSAPLALIGNSFKDVFYEKIANLIKESRFAMALTTFKRSSLFLLAMALPICLILVFFGDILFAFVFGMKWERSGLFASILVFSSAAKLVVSPLSSVFNATYRLKQASIWQVCYFITTFLTLGYSAAILKLEILDLFYVYVVHEIIMYGVYYAIQYRLLANFRSDNIPDESLKEKE